MKSNQRLIKYFLFNTKKFFVEADELVNLSTEFNDPSIWTLLDLFFPFMLLIISIMSRSLPDIMALLSVYKSFIVWRDWLRYKELRKQFEEWSQIVDALGGPFITTNDTTYQSYVIADGMQRCYDSIFKYLK